MDTLDLIIDYHKDGKRLGPGSDEATKRALSFVPQLTEDSRVLDIGCGTGAQTFLQRHNYSQEAKDFVEIGKIEMEMYKRFKEFYSYVFYS